MPSNLMKLSSSSMESGFHNHSDFERSGSFDSQGSRRSRSRSSNLDDENLKYLTNEEKNALMFLEETLDAFEDDLDEPPLSLNSSLGYYSPRSTEDSHSDTDDIIDLVQTEHNHIEDSPSDSGIGLSISTGKASSQSATSSSLPVDISARSIQKDSEKFSPELPAGYPKLLGAVPTPVIIAQKISEKKSDNGNRSPLSAKDEKLPGLKKNASTSPISEGHFIFPGSPNAKPSRFPNNINIKLVGKQYNKTIAKAAVNVQERKAQVLANLHGPGLFADEIDGKNPHDPLGRRTSFRDVISEQTRYEALTKLGLVKEIPIQADFPSAGVCRSPVSNGQYSPKFLPPESHRRLSNEHESISNILKSETSAFVPLGKTVVIKGESASPLENKRHSSPQGTLEQKQPNAHQEIKRSSSMPRPPGFWPQGITVQFSGRHSSEESRKDALRRLGLLKELSGH